MFSNTFQGLVNQLGFNDESSWGQFATSAQAEVELPAKASRLTAFQKMLLVQVFRPDRLESAMNNFVKEAFGG